MDIQPGFLDEREAEELDAEEQGRPVSMPGTGAPVLKIGEGCYLTLPTNPD